MSSIAVCSTCKQPAVSGDLTPCGMPGEVCSATMLCGMRRCAIAHADTHHIEAIKRGGRGFLAELDGQKSSAIAKLTMLHRSMAAVHGRLEDDRNGERFIFYLDGTPFRTHQAAVSFVYAQEPASITRDGVLFVHVHAVVRDEPFRYID